MKKLTMKLVHSGLAMSIAVLCFATQIRVSAQSANDTMHLLLPGQMFIRGIDNHANNGTAMVINLSNSVDIERGTRFVLTDSEYIDSTQSWQHVSGGVSGISVEYTGSATLEAGSSICVVIPYSMSGSSQTVQTVKVDGSTSANFTTNTIGKADSTSGVIPSLQLNKSGVDHLYIAQSGWSQNNGSYTTIGPIIDGFVSATGAAASGSISVPPSLSGRDIVHQTPSSFYAFVVCDDLLYFCDLVTLLNDPGNWTISTGTSGDDLDIQGICDAVCNFSDCDGAIEFQEIPLEGVCNYSICYGAFTSEGVVGIQDIQVDGISLDGEPGFSFPYCWNTEYVGSNWQCDYTGDYSCPPSMFCATDLVDDLEDWLTLEGYIFEDIYMLWDRGIWCLNIIQTDAEFEIAFFGVEADAIYLDSTIYNPDGTAQAYLYDTVSLGTLELNTYITKGSCTYGLYKIVAIPHGCPDAEFDWGGGQHDDFIVVSVGNSYNVTMTCSNSCTYEDGRFLEPESLQEEEVEVRSVPLRDTLSLRVFPNPAKEKIYFEVNSLIKEPHYLTVTSINGAVVLSEEIQLEAGEILKEMDLNALPAGLFLVKVSAGKSMQAAKFAVIK